MKISKLLLAIVAASVMLGVLVASASAGRLRISAIEKAATWTRMNFAGGFGTVECEVVLRLTFHSGTFRKTVGLLLGYVTEANVTRCVRGGATVNRESLPWHDTYAGFTGTLPDVTGISKLFSGSEWKFREPTFGGTCLVAGRESSVRISYAVSSGTITSSSVSGANRCGISEGEFSGITTNVTSGTGARLSITLI